MPAASCAAGSPEDCQVTDVAVSGYSAGKVTKVTNGLEVKKSTEKNSCPSGWKIWSPRNKDDWTLVYNALGKDFGKYPQNPNLIVDVTSQEGCGGCSDYAMNSGVSEQSSWKTSDGSAWWLRDSKYKEPSGNYHADCYLAILQVDPNDVKFDDRKCKASSTDYFCQPVQSMYANLQYLHYFDGA